MLLHIYAVAFKRITNGAFKYEIFNAKVTSETTSRKVRGNNVDFSTIEITSKKVRGNDTDFSISKITSEKVRGNDVDFSIREIITKKYVEMTWKFVKV